MCFPSKLVSVLVTTISSANSVIIANNYFITLELVYHLKDKKYQYIGTARDGKIGSPSLKIIKDREKKSYLCGARDYASSDDDILAVRWKDIEVVTLVSANLGVDPVSTCQCFCKKTKKKDDLSYPNVITSYNANIGGTTKNDMLIHCTG